MIPRGWHAVAYKTRICWIALGAPYPFKGMLLPPGGKFGFGQSRAEAIEALAEAIACAP